MINLYKAIEIFKVIMHKFYLKSAIKKHFPIFSMILALMFAFGMTSCNSFLKVSLWKKNKVGVRKYNCETCQKNQHSNV